MFLVPKSIDGRDDFLSIDPTILTDEQLRNYQNEMKRLIEMEKENLKRLENDLKIRLEIYQQGIRLAKQTSISSTTKLKTIDFQLHLPQPFNFIDPKFLTKSQLKLYVEGIEDEIIYEKNLTEEFKNESQWRIEAYEKGVAQAINELSIRKGQ